MITITVKNGTLSPDEEQVIREKAEAIKGCDHATVTIDDEWLNIDYHVMPFFRLARITGYLTNDINRWNDAKQAELKDRVKHGIA
jgi:hypothetical protein